MVMLKIVRYDATHHREIVGAWLAARQGADAEEGFLPETGLIIEDEDGPCMAEFVWYTQTSRRLFIDTLIARPGLSGEKAGEGAKLIMASVRYLAELGGYTTVTTTVDNPRHASFMEMQGWKSLHPVSLMVLNVPLKNAEHQEQEDPAAGHGPSKQSPRKSRHQKVAQT